MLITQLTQTGYLFSSLFTVACAEEPIIIDVGGPPNNLIGYNGIPPQQGPMGPEYDYQNPVDNSIGYNGIPPQQVPMGPEYGYQNPVDDSMYYYNNMNPMFSGSGKAFFIFVLIDQTRRNS